MKVIGHVDLEKKCTNLTYAGSILLGTCRKSQLMRIEWHWNIAGGRLNRHSFTHCQTHFCNIRQCKHNDFCLSSQLYENLLRCKRFPLELGAKDRYHSASFKIYISGQQFLLFCIDVMNPIYSAVPEVAGGVAAGIIVIILLVIIITCCTSR